MPAPDAKVIARIGRPHGLRGEVTVELHTDDPGRRLVPGARYATKARAGSGVPRVLTIRSARRHRQIWMLAFEEIPDRTGAEALRGTRLLLDSPVADPPQARDAQGAVSSAAAYEDDHAQAISTTDGSAPHPPATHGGTQAGTYDEDGWYEEDLVGLSALTPSGEQLGEVVGLIVGTAQDLLRVRLTDGRTALVPFVTAIVPQVDTQAGTVVIDAPPGLLELAE